MAEPFDRSLIGQEFDRSQVGPLTVQELIDYARAYGETSLLYTDEAAAACGPHGGVIAAPTFAVSLRVKHAMPGSLPRGLGRRGFDAGKDIELGVPIRPGDVLTAVSTVHDLYEKTGRSGRMTFLVFRTTVTNQRGQMAAVIDQRMMFQ